MLARMNECGASFENELWGKQEETNFALAGRKSVWCKLGEINVVLVEQKGY